MRRAGTLSRPLLRMAMLLACMPAAPCLASNPQWLFDNACDAAPRQTDVGGDGLYQTDTHHPVDLLSITAGQWEPTDPAVDRFDGEYDEDGLFLRIDIAVAGLMNPPGPAHPVGFDPFRYGPHPVFGFIEVDVDENHNTGGEVDAPQYRYLSNVARFGGIPTQSMLRSRAARSGADIDASFQSSPHIERSGEEFHLALLGDIFSPGDVDVVTGNLDAVFDAGEIWDISGAWFHRAHCFEPYSLVVGGATAGEYAPTTLLRFAHDGLVDETVISLVFPLTNEADAALRGEPIEADDFDPSNQASVQESLEDLVISAELNAIAGPNDPEAVLIRPWRFEEVEDHLTPEEWRLTALLGSTCSDVDPAGEFYVWTDVYPNVARGDIDGEHGVDADDVDHIADFIEDNDLGDGQADGRVSIADFGAGFEVVDVNQDGFVDDSDMLLASALGDVDDDEDVDLRDFVIVQGCSSFAPGTGGSACLLSDLNLDGAVDACDVARFVLEMTGPSE